MGIILGGNTLSGTNFNSLGETPSTPNLVTNGLVLHLDAGDYSSYINSSTYYDCGYGCQYYASNPGCTSCNSQWKDISGFGNDGTLNGGMGISYNTNGGVMVFDGSNDDIRTTLFTNARTNVTMSGWFFVNLGTIGTFLSNGDDPGGYCIGIGQYFGTADNQIVGLFGYVRWILTGAYYQYTGWHHIVMILDGSGTPSIYVNAVLIGSYPGTIANVPSSGTGFSIGSQWGIRYANTSCAISNFYNRALTATEVLQNFNNGRQRFGV
jgi:hypothetical protein